MTDLRRLRITTDILTVLVFAAALGFALVGVVIHRYDVRSDVEKRVLATRPKLTITSWLNQSFQPAMEKYLSDHFGGRTTLVRWNARLNVELLHTSSSAIVTVGRGGWLLYSGEQALAPYQPDKPQPSGAEAWAARAVMMRDALQARGIPFVLLVAPNPPSVAEDTLPAGYRREPVTNLDAFLSAAKNTDLSIIDPRAALTAARAHTEVYLSTDSHWNSFGALVASNMLLQTLSQQSFAVTPWPTSSYSLLTQAKPVGDLAAALGLDGTANVTTVIFNHEGLADPVPPPDYGITLQQPAQVYTMSTDTKPRAVIFRDSYANAMMPYLNESFSRTVYVRSRLVIPEVVDREKPDVVIMEIAERYLPDIGTPSIRESENGITQ